MAKVYIRETVRRLETRMKEHHDTFFEVFSINVYAKALDTQIALANIVVYPKYNIHGTNQQNKNTITGHVNA